MKKDYFMLIPLFTLIIIIVFLLTGHIAIIDSLYNYIVFPNDLVTTINKIITFFGSFLGIITIVLLLAIFYKPKKHISYLTIVLVISCGVNFLLKNIVRRARPSLIHLVNESGFSFPSGHAMAACTCYGFLIYLLWQSDSEKRWKIVGTILLSLLILLIGYSRIYLNVHYVSDVLAGFSLSIIILYLFIKCYGAKKIK